MKKRSLKKSKKVLIIMAVIIAIILMAIVLTRKGTSTFEMTPEIARSQAYDVVEDGDKKVTDTSGNVISAIEFDAFFLKDIDGDEYAESLRGACNEVGTSENLYMELKLLNEGHLKEGKITINADNFYFYTNIVKDAVISENYLSSTNTKTITLNGDISNVQSLIMGSVRSGDYSSSTTTTSAIGNDTNKYSSDKNSVTFSGIYVDGDGNEIEFSKTVGFTVDWYGEVNCSISTTSTYTSISYTDINNYVTDEGFKLSFTVRTAETLNKLIMESASIYGTIPELNGYKPTSVKITGSSYTYDEETGEYTATRTATLNSSGVVTSNAYNSSNSGTRYNTFTFTVIYPIEAYEAMGEDVTSWQLVIPVNAVNTGYNNPNIEDGFENPYTSDIASTKITYTWKKYAPVAVASNPSFNIYVGTKWGTPYNAYAISKKKPINIYNGISLEETDDTYRVEWRAYTGTYGTTDGIIMQETTGKTDEFYSSGTYISMDELTTNKAIYFSGATSTLGSEGWIKVYDADTGALINTFTAEDWDSTYYYDETVKHIRVETSSTNALSYFYVYNIKELDDEYITENYTRSEFDNLTRIHSYLTGSMNKTTTADDGTTTTSTFYKSSPSNSALYEAPTSIATISITESTISSQTTAENEKIKISTVTSGYNEQGWENGIFLIQLPKDILLAEINSVTTSNSSVSILAYDLYEDGENYYIKIITQNAEEASYTITIDCDLTPDPRISKTTGTVKLWAYNEVGCDYFYPAADDYDIDGDANTSEYVNYRTCTLTMDPGSSLSTTQIGSDYDGSGDVTIAPRVAKTDKSQRTATITVSATNNYSYDITNVEILGVIPFEGNKYVVTGNDLGSTYTTTIKDGFDSISGISEEYVTIYYSTNETPTKDVDDTSNGWTLAENVEDWSEIKTYLIVIDSDYTLSQGDQVEFTYTIYLPEGVDYNEVTYSEHAVYFDLIIDPENNTKYSTYTSSAKLGFMIAKQYDLEIVKYQEDTTKVLQGITFTITEDGADSSSIKVTDENGKITVSGLYVERYYTIQEIMTTDDYVLDNTEIRFYTYTVINDDKTESLYIAYVDEEGNYLDIAEQYGLVKSATVTPPDSESEQDYKITFEIEDEVKARLAIYKTDGENSEPLKNVKFRITGEGINTILTTDSNGYAYISGLYLDNEYVIEEVKATGYYVLEGGTVTVKVINDNGEFKLTTVVSDEFNNYDIGITSNVTEENYIPTINLYFENEKIPTYSFQITKYNTDGETLKGAQFKIYGEGISSAGKIYTTDENGVLTIDGLYEYVEGKYITGEYTITEIYAPEGYALDSTTLRFRAYRENGTLTIKILEGESVIRTITTVSEETEETIQDLNIENASTDSPTIQIGVENKDIFKLYKQDGNTYEPMEGAKFIITDLDGNYVYGTDGKIVGTLEEIDGVEYYVVTTDELGSVTANLGEGLYKVKEVYVDEAYVLDDTEYYFGIGVSQAASVDWVQGIQGNSWNYINSIDATSSGVIAVGNISETDDGADVNGDEVAEVKSTGGDDGMIVAYDVNGNYMWSKVFGGSSDDELKKVNGTLDGGYIVVGYTSSNKVYLGGTEITSLAKSNYSELVDGSGKDGVILKLDSVGNCEWAVRIGGTKAEEIVSVTELSNGNYAIVGNYYSDTLNFYNAGGDYSVAGSIAKYTTTANIMNGFLAVYNSTGVYQWSQRLGSSYDVEMADVTETSKGIAIALNHISTVYLNTSNGTSQAGASTSYTNGLIVGYTLDGTYSWRYRFYPSSASYDVEVTSISTSIDDTIIASVNYAYILYGSLNGGTATTIVGTAPTSSLYDGAIVELSNTGTYQNILYSLSGNYDDYISSVEATSDGGVLLGGWYYSDSRSRY